MKNNIKAILKQKEISIRRLSIGLGKPYSYTHNLVTRDDISSVTVGTLKELSELLGVNIEDLYK